MKQKAVTCALLAVLAGPAAAQEPNWEYGVTIYGWVPGIGGSISTAFGDLEMSSGQSDVLSSLKMAFMGTFEADNGRWSLIGDLLYADLGNTTPTPFGVLFAGATTTVKMTALSGYAMYRVVDDPGATVEIGGGFRFFDLDINSTLAPGTLAGRTLLSGNESWVDPLLAVRGNFRLSDNWSISAVADGGGFGIGSDSTWQVLGTIDYRFNDKWSVRVGYRYLDIDKPMQGRNVNLNLSGPVIGATFRF